MKKTIFLLMSALIWHWSAVPVGAQQRGRPQTLQVPSDRFPTIQSAINFAAAGDKILIAPGVYNETLTIAKRITLTGSGARGDRRTEIVGPRPTEVVPIERATGIINYQPGGGGKIESLLVRGGHAGIKGEAIEGRFPAVLEVKELIIHQGGRGIAGSFSDLTVEETKVADMLWHGVSIVQAKGKIMFSDSVIQLCLGIGCLISNTTAGPGEVSLLNSVFGLNSGGGILIHGNAKPVLVTKCFISNNRYAGIRLNGVGLAAICHNLINFTQPRLSDGNFGDGIVAECSENVIICQDNQNFALDFLPPTIAYNARAGLSLLSSHAAVSNALFQCNIFSLEAEDIEGSPCSHWSIDDLGGNQCSETRNGTCDSVICQVKSPGGPQPPEPIPPP